MTKQQYAFPAATILSLIFVVMFIGLSEAVTTRASAINRPDPWDRQTLPPQPRLGYYQFLGECINNLTKPCGLQVFDFIYGKAAINRPCCRKVKDMGHLCGKSLSLTLSQIQKYKPDAQLIIKKSDEAYEKCVKIASATRTTSKTK